MLRAHDEQLEAAGEPKGSYFFDMFVLNQHLLTKDCTSDAVKQAELVAGLRNSLVACGHLLLCCSRGPSGKPGWESPAPLSRIWCVRAAEGRPLVTRASRPNGAGVCSRCLSPSAPECP